MKKTLFVLSVFALTFLMSGCVISITRDPWALKPQYGWYIPSVIYSAEEATANLKNAQNSILINGRTPTELDIDKFALHATMRWDVVEENKEYVPYYGGVFIGWDYEPIYGGSYQTTQTTTHNAESAIVTFKDINNILITGNAVYINMDGGNNVGFVSGGGLSLQKLADSFYSLSYALGRKLKLDGGFSYDKMTQRQAAEIGLDGGLYVPWVFSGSPAEKSGLRPNDVILEVDGGKVTENTAVDSIVADATAEAAKKGYFDMLVFHWERSSPESIKWEKRSLKIYPVER